MGPAASPELRKDRYFLLGLLLAPLLGGIIIVFTPLNECGGRAKIARAGAAHALLVQLESAVKAYELDQGTFPPGDGMGTASLVRCLAKGRKPRCGYFEFPSEDLGLGGNLPDPVSSDKIVHYRCPGLHRPESFDLWCEDGDGRPDGINNWTP
jgi:hypothetical protein